MNSLDRLAELKRQKEAESVFQSHSDQREQEVQEIQRLQQSREARENREAQQARPINRLAELKRKKAEDPQASADARAQRRQGIEEIKKKIQAREARCVQEEAARAAQRIEAAHAAQRMQEAHEAQRMQEARCARRAQEAQEQAARRAQEAREQAARRDREIQCALDLEDARELAEIQEYETLMRVLAHGPPSPSLVGPSPLVASVAPARTSAILLQSAVDAARQALLFADKVRRDIFLEEREEKLHLLASNHEGRMRAECERVDRGVTVAPIEYILGFQRPPRGGPEPVGYYRVILGNCNLTFSWLPNIRNKLTGIQWETQFGGNVVPWQFWNPVKGGMMAEIDPDFQDDVFILPHFREEIATHLETHSLIHAANRENWFFLGPNMSGLDQTFEVTLKFLARMKKFNRLEFARISV